MSISKNLEKFGFRRKYPDLINSGLILCEIMFFAQISLNFLKIKSLFIILQARLINVLAVFAIQRENNRTES